MQELPQLRLLLPSYTLQQALGLIAHFLQTHGFSSTLEVLDLERRNRNLTSPCTQASKVRLFATLQEEWL